MVSSGVPMGRGAVSPGRLSFGACSRHSGASELYEAEATQRVFIERQFAGYTVERSSAAEISILLFLSMLPLHNDRPDRQQAFLTNALRLFKNLK